VHPALASTALAAEFLAAGSGVARPTEKARDFFETGARIGLGTAVG